MTFKEFIAALFEKCSCEHEWKPWQTSCVTDEWGRFCEIFYFKCNKCGRFKKIKTY